MEVEPCNWYLLKVGDEYGLQYTGEDVEETFPAGLAGAHNFSVQEITF